MSMYLCGKNGNGIVLNSCGRDLVGYICALAGARLSPCNVFHMDRFPGLAPVMAYEGTAEEAAADAAKIAALPDDRIRDLMLIKNVCDCVRDADRLVECAREWQEFLSASGGYDSEE